MTTIDYSSFPTIVETIANTDVPTLIAFRALSRAWRDRADKSLFDHILIGRPVAEMKPDLDDRGFEMRSPHAPYHRLPCLPFDAEWSTSAPGPEWTKASRRRTRRSLKNVRIIDYYGAITAPLESYFPNVQLLRRQWPKVVPSTKALAAPNTVDYLNFTSPANDLGLYVGVNIDEGIKQYTLHVEFDVMEPPDAVILAAFGKPEMVTIIFEPEFPDTYDVDDLTQCVFMFNLLRSIQDLAGRGIPVTLVGVDTFKSEQFQIFDRSRHPTVIDGLKGLLAIDMSLIPIPGDIILSNVTFLTHAEWNHSRGKDNVSQLAAERAASYVQVGNDTPWYGIADFNTPGLDLETDWLEDTWVINSIPELRSHVMRVLRAYGLRRQCGPNCDGLHDYTDDESVIMDSELGDDDEWEDYEDDEDMEDYDDFDEDYDEDYIDYDEDYDVYGQDVNIDDFDDDEEGQALQSYFNFLVMNALGMLGPDSLHEEGVLANDNERYNASEQRR